MRWAAVLIVLPVFIGAAAHACGTAETLTERLIRHEGFEPCVYVDTLGNPTIGVGHLLARPAPGDLCWPDSKVRAVLYHDILRAEANARHDVGHGFDALPDGQRAVLIEMAFQLGGRGLAEFHHMLAAVREGDFARAAAEIIDSRLDHQTPARAEELAALMRDEPCSDG